MNPRARMALVLSTLAVVAVTAIGFQAGWFEESVEAPPETPKAPEAVTPPPPKAAVVGEPLREGWEQPSAVDPADFSDQGDGLAWADVVVGDGKAFTRDELSVLDFALWNERTDEQLDNTLSRQAPYELAPGSEELMAGLNLALEGMAVGGVRQVRIPPALGFERARLPTNVGPADTLIGEIRLHGVVPARKAPAAMPNLAALAFEARPMGYEATVVTPGEGAPPEDTVTFDYSIWLADGTLVESSMGRSVPLTRPLGRGAMQPTWEPELVAMGMDERRILRIPPELGFGDAGKREIPGGATLVVELVRTAPRFQRAPSTPTP